MQTAVIYARYSCDQQTEQSIEGQLRVCEEYAQRNNLLIVDTYIDRAMTGTNDNRPDFQKMIKDSAKHKWNYVIVYKLDRFSRDKYATAIHKKTLRDNGVKVLSAMENIPDSPEGIILESLLEGYKLLNGHNKNVVESDVKNLLSANFILD
jgi:DNA invertase Pin-like site-specific DNA recombinase